MAFLRSPLGSDGEPEILGLSLRLRPPGLADFEAWSQLRALSRAHLEPWEPQWALDELTRAAFRRRLKHYAREQRDDAGYAFLIVRKQDDALLGGLTLSNVRRGVTQAAALGYWLGVPHIGRGLMTDAVQAIAAHAFGQLRLHRLEAACIADNTASMRVLAKSGFRREGTARRYLKINGIWRDHVQFGLLEDDPRCEVASS